MKGAKASGPPCERNKAFCGVRQGPQQTREALGLDFAGCFGLPTRPWLVRIFIFFKGSHQPHQSPNLPNLGRRNHLFLNTVDWSRWLAHWATARMMVPAISGCLSAIILMASTHLAHYAACLNLTALLKPSPPMANGRLFAALAEHAMAPGSTPTNVQKQLQICASCWAAKSWVKLGLTIRMKKFALAAAQNKRTNQAH